MDPTHVLNTLAKEQFTLYCDVVSMIIMCTL